MEDTIPCSILILTRNSANTLGRCLKNLSAFGEILVHDANSEDHSVEVAKSYGARVVKQYDTEQKSVRITDFTAMRFKQRDAAKYDWVIYIDSDEFLADELVGEIREVLTHASPKTVIKFPRLPIIENRIRTAGLFFPEIVPRIHHRKSGCTFKAGKLVHEKYVYDDSFTEIVTRHPIYVPLETAKELRDKDDRYITMELDRIRKNGYPWSHYIRWMLLREPFIMLWIAIRILLFLPRYLRADAVPFTHEWRYVRYHRRLLWMITKTMFAHPLARGKSQP